MSSPPPPALGHAEARLSPSALNQLLAADPERAAALLRPLDGEAYVSLAERYAALAHAPLIRILNEWGNLLALAGEPRSAPLRPRPPRRWPSITPTIPQRKPRMPHSPGDGKRRRWPRIRSSHLRLPALA